MENILYMITYCDDFWFIYRQNMQWWYVVKEIVIGMIFFNHLVIWLWHIIMGQSIASIIIYMEPNSFIKVWVLTVDILQATT